MTKTYANYIAGDWAQVADARANINPSDTDDVIGEYAAGTAADVHAAVDSATAAFPAWRRASPQLRADALRFVSEEILSRRQELGRLLSREEGKPLAEGIAEVVRAGQIFGYFSAEAVRLSGERLASVRAGSSVEILREPLGVVGLIAPWNFPAAIPAWKIAPALAYGNTVVFKPADLVPGSAWAIAEIISRSGLPEGVFNLVMGRGSVVGDALIDNERVAAISFTGSEEVGRAVAARCVAARRMKKVQLEMGGKNPLVVLDDADLGTAVECAVNGAFYSTGQRCTASSRLIVADGIHDAFVARLTERMERLVVGDALDSGTHIGPVVSASQLQTDLDYIALGRQEGGHIAFGGEKLSKDKPGFYLQPTLFTGATNGMRTAREEIFGPVASVIRVRNYEEALHAANDTPFGLSAGICTTSLKHAAHFKENAEAGLVMVNLPTAGVDYHVPFGGRKGSSYGAREQGHYAVEFYTETKTAYTNPL